MKKILITGSNGMLGKAAVGYFLKEYEVVGIDIKGNDIFLSSKSLPIAQIGCNIIDQIKLEEIFKKEKPDIVLHCAALIDVDYCENNIKHACDVNIIGTDNIVSLCKKYSIKMIYISTSMVFDGSKSEYFEDDITNPLNYYAVSKRIGEVLAITSDKNLVIRTNIIGLSKGSYFDWVYKKIINNERLGGYTNINLNAIYVNDFVKYIDMLLKAEKTGVYHITSRDWVSKYKFAKMLEKEMGKNRRMLTYKTRYQNEIIKRPENAVLNCSKFEREFNLKFPTVKETLKKVLKDKENGES
jgi:dTDP-4-dehydrorhamnose reductase